MPGYVYDNGEDLVGYLFCGKLNPAYSYAGSYYFVKTDVSATPYTRADFFVSDKTLTGNYSVKLPFNTDPKWVAVGGGSSYSVELKTADNASLGTWYTCDYGASVPEAPGTQYSFANANNISGVTVPDKSRFEALIENCSWTKLTVHGQTGFLGSAASGFLFFPANAGYWSSTDPWSCSFSTDAAKPSMSDGSGTGTGYCVRPVLD